MAIDRNQLQMIVGEKEELLTRFFINAYNYIEADKGLLSFVDSQNHLRILVQKGEYWHLPADRGISGVAFKTGETQIAEPFKNKELPFQGTGKEIVISEIAVPLFLNEEVIGILLFDSLRENKLFSSADKDYLEEQRRKVEEALDERDPWSFRSWWAREQRKKRQTILANTKERLKGTLRDEFARYADVEIRIAEVNENGISGPYETLLEAADSSFSTNSSDDGRDPLVRAIQQGKAVFSGEAVPRHRCYIPFPTVGPIVGVIKMESGVQGLLTEETMNKVVDELQKIQIDPLTVVKHQQINDHYYLNFVHNATKSHLYSSDLAAILERVASEATKLCGCEVNIFCSKELHKDIVRPYSGRQFKLVPHDELFTTYLQTRKGEKPDRLCRTSAAFICPVLNHKQEVIAAISVQATGQSLEDQVNIEVIESMTVLVMEIIANIRMRLVYDRNILNPLLSTTTPGIPKRPSRIRSQEEGESVLTWLLGLKKIELHDVRVVGNYVSSNPELKEKLLINVDDLASKAVSGFTRPFPVLICAPPGSGKNFFVEEFARAVQSRVDSTVNILPLVENLAPSNDLVSTLGLHFTKILIAPEPRIALLKNVDSRVNGKYAFRFLMPGLDGEHVDLGNRAKAPLPSVLWFFTSNKAKDAASFKKAVAGTQQGEEFFLRCKRSGMVIELPALVNGRDIIYQVVSTAITLRKELKQVQAIVLYYFAVSSLEDTSSLRGAVRTAVQDMGKRDILKVGDIANRPDFGKFTEVHSHAIKKLGQKLVQCR